MPFACSGFLHAVERNPSSEEKRKEKKKRIESQPLPNKHLLPAQPFLSFFLFRFPYDSRSIFVVNSFLLLPALRRLAARAAGTGLDRTLDLPLPMAIVDLDPTTGMPAE